MKDRRSTPMAEGARFELADPLRGLRFSRPARSAAPSPLRDSVLHSVEGFPEAELTTSSILPLRDPLGAAHILAQGFRNDNRPVRLLVILEDCDEGSADRES